MHYSLDDISKLAITAHEMQKICSEISLINPVDFL